MFVLLREHLFLVSLEIKGDLIMSALIKKDWDSFYPSVRKQREQFFGPLTKVMDEWFNDTFPELGKVFNQGIYTKSSYPKIDIIDYNDKVEIIAEIVGLSKEDVKIKLEDDILTICGNKRTEENKQEEGKYIYREIKRTAFERDIQLNSNLDKEKMKAKFENGVLNITIPKKVSDVDKNKEIIINID